MKRIEPPKKSKRGGARPNSGPKPKYGEPTKIVQTRCPVSKIEALKEAINKSLEEWEVKKTTTDY
jgi:hypothetical protein